MSTSIKKDDVIEELKSLKLHKLLRVAYRCDYKHPSLVGLPELFVSTKTQDYWLRIITDGERITFAQKRFLFSQSNPLILYLDQKSLSLTLYCESTDLVLNHTLTQLALSLSKQTGCPWKLRQRPLIGALTANQQIKEAANGNV